MEKPVIRRTWNDPLLRANAGLAIVLILGLVALYLFGSPGQPLLAIPGVAQGTFYLVAILSLAIAFVAFGRYRALPEPLPFWIGVALVAYAVANAFTLLGFANIEPLGPGVIAQLLSTQPWLGFNSATFLAAFLLIAPLARWPRAERGFRRWWIRVIAATVIVVASLQTLFVVFEANLPTLVTPEGETPLRDLIYIPVLIALVTAPLLFARRYRQSGDILAGYTALAGSLFAAAYIALQISAFRFDLPFYTFLLLLVSAVTLLLFGLMTDYVGLFRREQERVIELASQRALLRDLNDTLERRVDERTARLRALAVELGQAEERERRRLARLLHDHFQQILVSARFQLGRLSASPSTVASADIERVAAAIDEAIRASRDLTAELIPPSLYDMGLPTALYGLTQMMAERHHLSVQVQLAPQADVGDTAMRAFLYQAARELLFNVVKHARVDRASLSLTAQESRIELTVEDAGAGFDLTDAAGDHKSFGLLNIRERAEYLGGRLEIAAAPGRGTRATLWVPVGQTVEPRHPRPTGMPGGHSQQIDIVHESAARPGAIRVVIADDHQMVRQGLVVMLNDEDDVTIVGQAANGQEALDVVRRIHPDVVLMDVTMPVMDGTEATLAIKREMPDVQVIGLSMHTDAHMASRMREAGAAGYIIKSGQIDELVDTIRRAIDDRRPRHPAMSPGGV